LSGPGGEVTHLLNVLMDVSEPPPKKRRPTAAERRVANRAREEASGVLRIVGVAPGSDDRKAPEALSRREQEVADLLAPGLTNSDIAHQLNVSPTTISSHVALPGAGRRLGRRAAIGEDRIRGGSGAGLIELRQHLNWGWFCAIEGGA